MKIERRGQMLYLSREQNSEYPVASILAAVFLLYLTPFTTSFLAIPATAICLYRVLRYDARVYAVDYCLVAPIVVLSRAVVGVPLLLYLSLFAAIRYFLRRGFRAEASYVILLILLNYLILRMQMDINALVLCFGQMFTLCILLPEQDDRSAERAIKAFCLNLLVSSLYSWIFRNHPAIRAITGSQTLAYWGSSAIRFKGLSADPNYFMTMHTVGIAAVLKLRDSGRIRRRDFLVMLAGMSLFGILSYSKTFFLMFLLLVGIYVIWQFWNKKVFRGVLMTMLAVAGVFLIFTMDNSPFAVVLERFRGAKTLSDFTTNRSDVYLMYLREITRDLFTFFFGKGMAAAPLSRDPHNLYLEIAYYMGVTGLLLTMAFYGAMVGSAEKRVRGGQKQNMIARYEVVLTAAALYFTLHGVFQQVLYVNLFVAYLSILLTKKEVSP